MRPNEISLRQVAACMLGDPAQQQISRLPLDQRDRPATAVRRRRSCPPPSSRSGCGDPRPPGVPRCSRWWAAARVFPLRPLPAQMTLGILPAAASGTEAEFIVHPLWADQHPAILKRVLKFSPLRAPTEGRSGEGLGVRAVAVLARLGRRFCGMPPSPSGTTSSGRSRRERGPVTRHFKTRS